MRLTETDSFIETVLSHVRFGYDHLSIRQELEEHITDMIDDIKSDDISEAEAEHIAILNMGDADEIGAALDKEHSPVLGNIWRVMRAAAVLAVVIFFTSVIFNGFGLIRSLAQDYDVNEELGEPVYTVDVGYKTKIDDRNIKIDELLYYDDGTMEVRYKTWYSLFSTSIDWTFNLGFECFYDEKGNNYFSSGGRSGGGAITRHEIFIVDFPPDAEKFIIDYNYNGRKIYCEIPLKEGASIETE
mgnify:FL=1